MGKYKPKVPPANKAAAESWIGKPVKDAQANTIGLVHNVVEALEGVRLLARFPGEKLDRKIALEMTNDRECLCPGEIRARYRPLTQEDLARIKR